MRPCTTKAEIPSTHDISNYINNSFVEYFAQLNFHFNVCCLLSGSVSMPYHYAVQRKWMHLNNNQPLVCWPDKSILHECHSPLDQIWFLIYHLKTALRSHCIQGDIWTTQGYQPQMIFYWHVWACWSYWQKLDQGVHEFFIKLMAWQLTTTIFLQLFCITAANTSNNNSTCDHIESTLCKCQIYTFNTTANQLLCLTHVNLGIEGVMSVITKTLTIKTTAAIWEYDPTLANNHVLGGSLDIVAAIWTLTIKIQASDQWITYFHHLQTELGSISFPRIRPRLHLHMVCRRGIRCSYRFPRPKGSMALVALQNERWMELGWVWAAWWCRPRRGSDCGRVQGWGEGEAREGGCRNWAWGERRKRGIRAPSSPAQSRAFEHFIFFKVSPSITIIIIYSDICQGAWLQNIPLHGTYILSCNFGQWYLGILPSKWCSDVWINGWTEDLVATTYEWDLRLWHQTSPNLYRM